MKNASSSVMPLSNLDSASQPLQQSREHQEELYEAIRHCAAWAKSTVGHKVKSLLCAIKVLIVDTYTE